MLPDLYLMYLTFHTWNCTNPNLQSWTNPNPRVLLMPVSVSWCNLHLSSSNNHHKGQSCSNSCLCGCGPYSCPYGEYLLWNCSSHYRFFTSLYEQSWVALLSPFVNKIFYTPSSILQHCDNSLHCHNLGSLIHIAAETHSVKFYVKV